MEDKLTTEYKSFFTIDKDTTYLNHAAVGLLPKSSVKIMKDIIQKLAKFGEPPIEEIMGKLNHFRENIGKLISVDSEDVAFIQNTTEGLSIALHSIPWKAGDNI